MVGNRARVMCIISTFSLPIIYHAHSLGLLAFQTLSKIGRWVIEFAATLLRFLTRSSTILVGTLSSRKTFRSVTAPKS